MMSLAHKLGKKGPNSQQIEEIALKFRSIYYDVIITCKDLDQYIMMLSSLAKI